MRRLGDEIDEGEEEAEEEGGGDAATVVVNEAAAEAADAAAALVSRAGTAAEIQGAIFEASLVAGALAAGTRRAASRPPRQR